MRGSDRLHRRLAGWLAARRALVAYTAAWLIGAAAVALAVIALLGDDDDSVALPPVGQTELDVAAELAGCDLQRAERGQVLNPPVTGARGVAPARPGFYDEPPRVASLTAALRRGIVVIHFRIGIDQSRIDELRTLQEAVPTGTIVTPNPTGMTYEVAVAAHRRLLGCPRFTDATLDAIRLFRGRRLGTGPDS